jgi:two-component system sensor histidine kinase UhpB
MMRRQLSLQTRVGLVFTGLAASLLLVLAGLWLHSARGSIHEEVEAASRVSQQWLQVVTSDIARLPAAEQEARLLGIVRPLGRIRANALAVQDAAGHALYHSPPPTYKAGRHVPAWFANLLDPQLASRQLAVGALQLQLQLTPDASRAIIDAWDDLLGMASWAGGLLCLIFLASRWALARALQPLAQVMQALDRTGRGRFDTRLPVFATPELGRLSRAFNGMADRLTAAVDDNVRLETEREVNEQVAEQMQARLESERRSIARELHDELAQGITAVRALAGAIAQRSEAQPALYGAAQNIVAVTSEMQAGVKSILQRLRPLTAGSLTAGELAAGGLAASLERHCTNWQQQHPDIRLDPQIELGAQPVDAAVAQAVTRIIQEGLTNVVRHAQASHVELHLQQIGQQLEFSLMDNGVGRQTTANTTGCGFGLAGMTERVAALGGNIDFTPPLRGGFALKVCLPLQLHNTEVCT